MRKEDKQVVIIIVLVVLGFLVFFFWANTAGSKESDPEVYKRYVEDMRKAGRNPNGDMLEPDAFRDSIWWMEGE